MQRNQADDGWSSVKVGRSSSTKKAPDPAKARVVGWNGDWICGCGSQYNVQSKCLACGVSAPCRDYLHGACPSASLCRFPHPPFSLPSSTPPPSLSKSEVRVHPEAPAYALRLAAAAAGGGGERSLRTISWMGDWACPCGEDNLFRDATCRRCKKSAPCREWVRGRCKFSDCRFPHTPFDLPPNQPERMAKSKDSVVVKPAPGAVMVVHPKTTPKAAGGGGTAAAAAGGGAGGGGAAASEAPPAREPAPAPPPPVAPVTAAVSYAAAAAPAPLPQAAPPPAPAPVVVTEPPPPAPAATAGLGEGGATLGAATALGALSLGGPPGPAPVPVAVAAAAAEGGPGGRSGIGLGGGVVVGPPAVVAAAVQQTTPLGAPSSVLRAASDPELPSAAAKQQGGVPLSRLGNLPGQNRDVRIVSWMGHWACRCGRRQHMVSQCINCGQQAPCRLWLTGECVDEQCPLPHPPFSMDEDLIPRDHVPNPVVKLWPGAPLYSPSSAPSAPAGGGGSGGAGLGGDPLLLPGQLLSTGPGFPLAQPRALQPGVGLAPGPASLAPGPAAAAATGGSGGQEGQPECMGCYEAAAHAVLVPCGHLVLCGRCAQGMFGAWGRQKQCPLCRDEVQAFHMV